MPTLHFSYSLGGGTLDSPEPLNSPYTIAWHVGRFLRDKAVEIGYAFHYQNLDDTTPCTFELGDIAIGHAWWDGGFMHQALDAAIKAKFILQPYTAGMVSPGDVGMVLNLWNKADHLFLITGEYWFDTMDSSLYFPLQAKATRLDMAINTALHPYSKTRWNEPGQRAVCCIGHDTPTKGYKHVAELARVAGFRLGHFGGAQPETFEHVPCFVNHGGHQFTPAAIARICEDYDAVITIPIADANPTILLEAAAWGLDVFCSQEAGYLPGQPFRSLVKGDMAWNVKQMRAWQQEDEYNLTLRSQTVRRVVEQEYTWTKFCQTLWSKVSETL